MSVDQPAPAAREHRDGSPGADGAGGSPASSSDPAGAPMVSVIMAARNAEATIAACLDSILSQDYAGPMEVIVADGSDTPATAEILRRLYPEARVVANRGRSTPGGLNLALKEARGDVVARCDGHSEWPPGYLSRAVATLRRTGAANVGCVLNPVGGTFFERAVALATTTWLGTGGARYRTKGAGGAIVDTAYLGVFRRDALEAVGGYHPGALRTQDFELNWRLRRRGEMIWLDPELVVNYQPRGGFLKLASQYAQYGYWRFMMLRLHPASLQFRQLPPPLLVAGLAASAALAALGPPWAPFGALVPSAWLAALLAAAAGAGMRRRRPEALLVPPVLAVIHLSWGAGCLWSMLRALLRRPGLRPHTGGPPPP